MSDSTTTEHTAKEHLKLASSLTMATEEYSPMMPCAAQGANWPVIEAGSSLQSDQESKQTDRASPAGLISNRYRKHDENNTNKYIMCRER